MAKLTPVHRNIITLSPREAGNIVLQAAQRFFAEQKLVDVKLCYFDETLFGCHKLILALHSAYFEDLLLTTEGCAILSLDAVREDFAQQLKHIIRFMYGHTIIVSSSDCSILLQAAKVFGVSALVKCIEVQLNRRNRSEEDEFVLTPVALSSLFVVKFQRFKCDMKLTDAKICYRDRLIYSCHKLVLASFSNYFESLLLGTEGCAILSLDAVDMLYVQQLDLVVRYMYGEEVRLLDVNVDLLLDAARVFGITSLQSGELMRTHERLKRVQQQNRLKEKLMEMRNRGTITVTSSALTLDPPTPLTSLICSTPPRMGLMSPLRIEDEIPASWSESNLDLLTGANMEIETGATSSDAGPSSEQSPPNNALQIVEPIGGQSSANLSAEKVCELCGEVIKLVDFEGHSQAHNASHLRVAGASLKCAVCNQLYTNRTDLRAHFSAQHQSPKDRLACVQCGELFSNKQDFNAHRAEKHSVAKRGKLVAAIPVQDKRKKKAAKKGANFRCETCQLSLPTKAALLEHARTLHVKEIEALQEPHTCAVCKLTFSTADLLNAHLASAHEQKVHKCPLCGKLLRSVSGYAKHMESHDHKRRKCDQCSFECGTIMGLKSHVKKYHEEQSARDKHTCGLCGATYPYACHLQTHMEQKHLHLKPFRCPFCDHATTERAALKTHIRSIHTKEKIFKCDFCEKNFATSSILARHRRTHTGVKPHKCGLCEDVSFIDKRSLVVHHNKVHAKVQPFKCQECGQGFLRSDFLKDHMSRKHKM